MNESLIFKTVCENNFAFYCKQFLKILEPETTFIWNWHLDAICNHCMKVYSGEIDKLDINVPPRTLKSVIVNILFPTWVWTKKPSHKFLCASRSYDLSISFNIKRRDVITSDLYQALWKIKLREDRNTVDVFHNRYGGFMQSVSALGKITGSGADTLLSDDLLDAMDAFSKSKRDAVKLWYTSAFYNRAQNKQTVRRININQRLHMEDISSVLPDFGFKTLIFPMVKEKEDRSTVEFRDPREEGELLFPKRYGEREMLDDMKVLGAYGWSSQYQQRPTPIGGGIIKEEWLRFYDPQKESSFERKIVTADLTFKGGANSDYNCFACWGIRGDKKYLIDIVRGKWTYTKTKEMFIEFCKKHNPQKKYIEDKANGSALIDDLKRDMTMLFPWPLKGSKLVNANKVERLYFVQPEFELGNVYLPLNIDIIEIFKEELLGFTDNGSTTGNDDMVDTTTMALLELKKSKTFFSG